MLYYTVPREHVMTQDYRRERFSGMTRAVTRLLVAWWPDCSVTCRDWKRLIEVYSDPAPALSLPPVHLLPTGASPQRCAIV
jgi:hypothetical protein